LVSAVFSNIAPITTMDDLDLLPPFYCFYDGRVCTAILEPIPIPSFYLKKYLFPLERCSGTISCSTSPPSTASHLKLSRLWHHLEWGEQPPPRLAILECDLSDIQRAFGVRFGGIILPIFATSGGELLAWPFKLTINSRIHPGN